MSTPIGNQQTRKQQNIGGQRLGDGAVRLVQLSDCHLGHNQDFSLAGVNTYQSFSQVLTEVTSTLRPSLIFFTGDIACEGKKASYQLFSEVIASTKRSYKQLDYRWLPGNHDDFQVMKDALPQPFVKAQVLGGWVAISMVSAISGRVDGELIDAELQELNDLLAMHKDKYILLFVHHPPVEIDCKWLDEQRISNSKKLKEVLAQHSRVKAIFTGHVHQESTTDWCGIPVYSTPSTCFQFTGHSETFDISDQPPGYRWIELYPDGQIKTEVEHVACGDQNIDRSCMGY